MRRFAALLNQWLPVVLWMGIIFSASSDRLSFQHTSRFIEPFARWLFPHISDLALHELILIVRKCGHLSEYAILALLSWRAFGSREQAEGWSWRGVRNTLLLVIFYAATDEFHQKFVPSREASIVDVLIDTLGGALGLLFLWIFGRWRKLW